MEKITKLVFGWVAISAIIGLLVVSFLSLGTQDSDTRVKASDFYNQLRRGEIVEVVIQKDIVISGRYGSRQAQRFQTYCSVDLYPDLGDIFRGKGIIVTDEPESWLKKLLPFFFLIPVLLLIIFLYYSKKGKKETKDPFSKSRAKLTTGQTVSTTFKNVAGAEEAKQELQEMVDFLKDPQRFADLGARVPRGVLLVGPAGTGKTLVARAVAGEAQVPFFFISGSEFVEMYVGVGAARVRDLFDTAKKKAPCIIFIDEIDAVGRQRGSGLGESHDEREQTLNQILVEMDGFDPRTNIIVIAATNRPDILDSALLRPGRFDRQVVLERPDIRGRKAILEIYAKGKPLAEGVNLETLAKGTPGFSGADLENVLNEAAILAGRRKKDKIYQEDLNEAVDRALSGAQIKSRVISIQEKMFIACHETGHFLLAQAIPGVEMANRLSCIPRGRGYTNIIPEEEPIFLTEARLQAEIQILLGGRIAEELKGLPLTTGAANDLERVTLIARKMITEYGMSKTLGPRTFGRREGPIFLGKELNEERNYSEKIAEVIDEEVKRIIDENYQKAKEILGKMKDKLDQISRELVVKETLEGDDLRRLLS